MFWRELNLANLFFKILALVLVVIKTNSAYAQLGSSEEQLIRSLGSSLKKSGDLNYYHKPPYNVMVHMYSGHCDQFCIYSDQELGGIPAVLSDDETKYILNYYGSGAKWIPSSRLSLNRVWRSENPKCLAIYDTMFHKMVLMTLDSYKREKATYH